MMIFFESIQIILNLKGLVSMDIQDIQQNEHKHYAQLNEMTVEFEMKSIHSNSSSSASDMEPSSPQQDSSKSAPTNITSAAPFPESNLQDEEHKQTEKQQIKLQIKVAEQLKEAHVSKECLKQYLPMAQNQEVLSSYEVNLLEDSYVSSKQLECVQSQKIYPNHPQNSIQPESEKPSQKQEIALNIIEENIPPKPQINNSNSKNKARIPKEKIIPCQRNTYKLASNQEKPLEPPKKIPCKQQKLQPVGDSQMKFNIEFEEYFQRCKFQFCGKRCPGGNLIEMVCVQKGCQSEASHCTLKTCYTCVNNHKDCYLKFTNEMFQKSLQKNLSRQKRTMQIVYQTYSNILNQIKKNREKNMKLLCIQGVNEQLLSQLEKRYKLHEHISFKSCEILNALEMLNTESQNNTYRENKIYEKMRQDEKDIMKKLEEQMHLLLEPYAVCEINILNSHLLTHKNDAKFILENLNCPKDMRLLYRASQHEFSIKKFHQICDKEDNTFTIIKTEFGKLIGAFTPLRWNNKQGRDRSNKTFLLSISMKEKLEHIKHGQSAIYYCDTFGPSFGGLFQARDIEIFEENGLLCCNTNFPNAYNWKKFFVSNQESWRFLTGVQAGKKCRVMDYEVFKVQFWNSSK